MDGGPAFGPSWSAALRRGSERELRSWLDLALACCDVADGTAMGHFRRDLVIETKPDRSFVTDADKAIERSIRERIAGAFPAHGLVGEEYGDAGRDASVRWYIDPIDGTHNFMRGVPLFGTLLGVERDGELQVGVLSAPALGERWFALRGGGAWAVRTWPGQAAAPRPLAVSRVSAIGDAQVLYGSATDLEASGKAPGFRALLGEAWRERGFGDFWGYALVAEGAAEAMVEADLHSWDLAAPIVLVEEAGGRITTLDGRRDVDGGSALASNGVLHERLLARLRGGTPGAG
jgi:histidinol-phosphatase